MAESIIPSIGASNASQSSGLSTFKYLGSWGGVLNPYASDNQAGPTPYVISCTSQYEYSFRVQTGYPGMFDLYYLEDCMICMVSEVRVNALLGSANYVSQRNLKTSGTNLYQRATPAARTPYDYDHPDAMYIWFIHKGNTADMFNVYDVVGQKDILTNIRYLFVYAYNGGLIDSCVVLQLAPTA